MNAVLFSLGNVILIAIQLYIWLLIASAVMSWLIAFNVVNTRNQFVATIVDFLWRVTEPRCGPSATSCRIWVESTYRRSS